MRQHCPIVHPYHVICCWQHVTRNTICKIVWKLSDSAWGNQCETKRSKQNMTMCSVHAVRRMCFANGEEHASTLAMARQQARDRKIQMHHGRQQATYALPLPQTTNTRQTDQTKCDAPKITPGSFISPSNETYGFVHFKPGAISPSTIISPGSRVSSSNEN